MYCMYSCTVCSGARQFSHYVLNVNCEVRCSSFTSSCSLPFARERALSRDLLCVGGHFEPPAAYVAGKGLFPVLFLKRKCEER